MEKRLTIAIDGYSSCGKSTFARAIAEELDYIYIDSGAMYRAVTLYCIRKGYIEGEEVKTADIIGDLGEIDISFVYNPGIGIHETFLNSENVEREIRSLEVSSHVSRISRIHQVRTRMVELQRQIGVNKGIVMDGRDIGTVVFPDADLKIFMTASVDIRAKRRYDELRGKNIEADLEEVRMNIISRDIADENRDISPLRRADDAIILDNSRMTVDQQMDWIMEIIRKKFDED
ncbi:MAG TPA: (d)CMP kinase [Bacteroidales bacterium]|mgnify:CR=1 FL=1|jgi:cytidylate kinase|nr:(d)CMP kinase [Bacteroidales bacterium]HOG57287.1 (d)CMP kinase [Bacteroidales bacterium]HPB13621.1 (d)CMP kinase [Bacteroidales bacterium]HPV16084.1 (d)CMP kinase [Bacteroidales bacterium]HQB86273.1 (d)CMP kinase [Bacteroidales bacterium]